MSNSDIKPNPILSSKYSDITTSADSNAIDIVTNFKKIYDNYVIFSNTPNNVVDTTPLDNAATQIQTSFNVITKISTPCISSTTSYTVKCDTDLCKWSADVENLAQEFAMLILGMTMSKGDIKEQYKFIGFFMTHDFFDLITNNKTGNFNSINSKYYLCSEYPITSKSTDPALKKAFDALQARMKAQSQAKDQRVNDEATKNFLTYILLPTVIFIILMLLYVFIFKPKTTTPAPAASAAPVKTGGALYDTLNFISTIGLKFIRI
jgi:hypothetical protein